MTRLFDTHVHLQDRAFAADRREVLARARGAGVVEMVLIGEAEASSRRGVELASMDEALWAAVGVHPHNAKAVDAGFDGRLQRLAQQPRVVAIGEIGLDYHYDRSPREVQRDVFRRQLAVAATLELPVVIHSREALEDTIAILDEWSDARRRAGAGAPLGVMHCFGYDRAAAERFVALGFMISIPGTVTYPRAEEVRQVARAVPADRLVIETDAPVLAPQEHRGKRNEPAYLRETAEGVAAIRGQSIEQLAEQTSVNARRLFRLPLDADADAGRESVRA
jgi:TatD DNase family protein